MYIYSLEKLLICGAQTARTRNTVGVGWTRSFALRGEANERGQIFRRWSKASWLKSAALSARDRLTRPDTAHYVIGFAPFGGADQFETRYA